MTHWKKLTNPDYLGAYSLENGEDLTLTISYVRVEKVTGPDGKREDLPVAHFSETKVGNSEIKPMILNTTNMKRIAQLYNTPYIENWAGKKITIYIEQVSAFGSIVDALRIRPIVPKETEYKCADCGAVIEGAGKLNARDVALNTQKKFGKMLCGSCWKKANEAAKAGEESGDVL